MCGTEIRAMGARGPSRRLCSARCRKRKSRATIARRRVAAMPAILVGLPRWTRADRKRPITTTGEPASTTNPATWTTHADVTRDGLPGTGIGFMLGDGIGCIDLDDAILTDGTIKPWAVDILDAAPGAWSEISQSGHGIHIFGYLPPGRGKVLGNIEIYSQHRFIAVTGNTLRPGRLVDLTDAARRAGKLAKASR